MGPEPSYANWTYINSAVTVNQTGNLTQTEPVNLLVGSFGGETLTGSGRADIVLGRGGADIIDGEGPAATAYNWGNDQLYGGTGNDTINAYRGNDLLHGGDRSLTISSQTALEADGVDTADYTPLYALDNSKGIAIQVTDQALDPTLAANVDAGFGTWVTDRGRGGDIDLLVSIETVKATAADDVLVVTKLDPARLAGADGTGGVSKVDLAGQASGDLIDLSGASTAMTVALSGSGRLYATAAPALKLYVDGAEQVLGSAYDDVLNGTNKAEVLAGGDGNDRLTGSGGPDTLFSGSSPGIDPGVRNVLSGEDGADLLVAQAGSVADLGGGAGADQFILTLDPTGTRQVRIVDSDVEDTIFWHGYQLSGGNSIHVETYVEQFKYGYTDSYGVVYSWA